MLRKRWSSLGAQKTTCCISSMGPCEPQEAPERSRRRQDAQDRPQGPPGDSQEAPRRPQEALHQNVSS
eukprot:5710258-Pyramimonas_sp.AAC.1